MCDATAVIWIPYSRTILTAITNLRYSNLNDFQSIVQHSPNTVDTKCSIYQCLHTSLHSDDYNSTHEYWFGWLFIGRQYRPLPVSSLLELSAKVNSGHSYISKWNNQWIESQYLAHLVINCLQINCLQIMSLLINWLQINSLQINSLQIKSLHINSLPINCLQLKCLQIHQQMDNIKINYLLINRFQTNHFHILLSCTSIMAFKYITKLTWWWNSWLNDHGLNMQLESCLFMAANSAQLWPPCVTPNPLNHSLQVPLQTSLTMASKYISTFTQSVPPTDSQTSFNHSLPVHHSVCLTAIVRCAIYCTQAPRTTSPNMHCLEWYLHRYIDT